MITFDSFKSEWLGRRVDYDHQYGFQCVDVIRQGFYEMHDLPGGGGVPSAISYWTDTPQEVLDKFDKIGSSEAQKGDVIILRTVGRQDYYGDGHIGWATGNIDATNVEILEQNGSTGSGSGLGGDCIRVRYVPKSRVAGLLRPINVTPPTPQPEVHPYSIEAIAPKQIRINKDTHRWGMTYDNFTAIANNPIAPIAAGTIVDVTAICRHNIGYNYYLPDANEPSGYNVLDCDDYVAPAPSPPEPLPVPTPPSAPLPIPGSQEYYTLVKTVMGYGTSNDAANYTNARGTVPAGRYYVFNRRTVAATGIEVLNLTKTVGMPGDVANSKGGWINSSDNVPDPEPIVVPVVVTPSAETTPVINVPTPEVPPVPPTLPKPVYRDDTWKATYVSFDPIHRTPRIYKALTNLVIRDISGARGTTIYVKAGDKLHVFGTFTRDNTQYGRLKIRSDVEFRYFFAARTTDMKRLATADLTPLVKVMDYFNLNRAKVERYEEDVINFMEMKPWFKKKNKNKEGIKK